MPLSYLDKLVQKDRVFLALGFVPVFVVDEGDRRFSFQRTRQDHYAGEITRLVVRGPCQHGDGAGFEPGLTCSDVVRLAVGFHDEAALQQTADAGN